MDKKDKEMNVSYSGIAVPEGLKKDLSDMIDSMDAAERIIAYGRSRMRRTMTWIVSVAAGVVILAGLSMAVVTFRTPKDTFTDPAMAYAEVERAFSMISEKMGGGVSRAGEAEESIQKQIHRFTPGSRDK